MTTEITKKHTHIEQWPFEPITSYTARVHWRRASTPQRFLGFMGSPNLAMELVQWLSDEPEDLGLQVWLRTDGKKIDTHLCLEVPMKKPGLEKEWETDLKGLTRMHDPKNKWVPSEPIQGSWKYGTLLDIRPQRRRANVGNSELIKNLCKFVDQQQTPVDILLSLNFSWEFLTFPELDKSKIPPMALERERRNRRTRHIQKLRRRICVLSDSPISSLMRQSVFRAINGVVNNSYKHINLQQKDIQRITNGPFSAFSFAQKMKDRATMEDICGPLNPRLKPKRDDIPF